MLDNLGVFKDYEDNSLKSVFQKDNKIIEMTLLFNKESMDVVCVPTHHFCNLGCKMCHLTNNKLNKAMVPINAEDFIEALKRTVYLDGAKRTNKKKILISFMGVGEPTLNLKMIEEIFKREKEIKSLGYEDVGYAISTMMPNSQSVCRLIELVNKYNKPLKLHFSLHTPIDNERKNLIPSTKVDVEEALNLLLNYRNSVKNNRQFTKEYIKFHRTDIPIEIHYTLISGINDSEKELNILIELLKKYKIPIKFIKLNPINDLKRSNNEKLWIDTLHKSIPDLRVKTYCPPGREIGSSCGEFTKHYYHEEIETDEERQEFEKWRKLHLVK
ncbi:MAG: hypothetical protein NC483_01895 [Ruminococcus sp.]|nr:hypothetical protein [Ruminococcus sp.]